MKRKQLYRYIIVLALASALCMAGMLVAAFAQGGVTAQHFETFAAPEAYANDLLQHAGGLQAILTLDGLFIALYTATILLLAWAVKTDENAWLVAASVIALLVATFLDMHENAELLTFVQRAKVNTPLTTDLLHSRAVWSAVKFNASYLSFFLLAFALPKDTFLERFLRWGLWFVYLPIGVLVYTFPNPGFLLIRYAFMLGGLLMLAWNFHLRRISK